MIKNYITVAFRNLWRNKAFSLINILGLSIGISSAIVIFLMAHFEFSFDRFIPGNENIYRVVLDINIYGAEGHSSGVQAPLGAAIRSQIPGIDHVVPVFQFQGDATANVSIKKSGMDQPVLFKKQPKIVFTDPEYFYLLPYHWIAGTPEVSMQDPFHTVMTESRAKLYFPGIPVTDIIGKKIQYGSDLTTTVSGIVNDFEENTSFTAIEFISLATIAKTGLQKQFMMDIWNDWMAYSTLYLKLSKDQDIANIEKLCTNLIKVNNPKGNQTFIQSTHCHLQPLNDIHFNAQYPSIGQRTANKKILIGLLFIAVFLILLACINFINLTTANATHRAKEIGIRKTMGSSKGSLVFQFLGETFFITCIATVISFCLAPIWLNSFKDFMPEGMPHTSTLSLSILSFLIALTILISFLSGLYPGLILSNLKPVSTLKGQGYTFSNQSRKVWVRQSLTVTQFVIAQFFLIATIVVIKQIHFSMNADLGFSKDAIITFDIPRDTSKSISESLLQKIKTIPEVSEASLGFLSPSDLGVAFTNIKYEGKEDIKDNIQIRWGDPSYMKVYGLKLIAGRNVEPSEEMKEFIINERYSKLLGFEKPEDALGKFLDFNKSKLPIVGVMQDFHDMSMRGQISPLVFSGSAGSTLHIRLIKNDVDGNTWKHGILKIKEAFATTYPAADFNFKFFDETIASMYADETKTASLLKFSTGLAVLISCLGLLGLVMFTINSRIKEIGIRKILGSSVPNIVSILSLEFIRLVCIAFVIAVPISWWAMHKWLNDFAYRTPLSWWVFVISGAMMLAISILTLSIQTIRAANRNPVISLRTE